MMEFRLYCKACKAFHSAYEDACSAVAQRAPTLNRPQRRSREKLLHNRYLPIQQPHKTRSADIIWAQDLRTRRTVVTLKRIALSTLLATPPADDAETPRPAVMVEWLRKYVKRLSALEQAGLVHVSDMFIERGSFYLVGDDVAGETLENYCLPKSEFLAQTGNEPRPTREVLDIGIQLSQTLGYLHQQDPMLTVRHLHPSTIVRDSEGHVFLAGLHDNIRLQEQALGNAWSLSPRAQMKLRGYVAPEQLLPHSFTIDTSVQPSIQANVYHLGVLLHQLATGCDPNEVPGSFASISTKNNPALRAFDHFLQQMLDPDPRRRPQHMHEVEASLRQIQRYYAVARVEVVEVLSPYEAARDETPQLTVVKKSHR